VNQALLVGFDSAWSPAKTGAIVGLLLNADHTLEELELPRKVNFREAEETISGWQQQIKPLSTLVLIDQPTIVENEAGQRPVEHIVSSVVSRRRGGMQPANRKRAGMFCGGAPIWPFLQRFGGPNNVDHGSATNGVYETYPVLAMVALGWTLPDSRLAGRLPKYNPARRKTFSLLDWRHVCDNVSAALLSFGLIILPNWIKSLSATKPAKIDQDGLDSCMCLLVAIHLVRKTTMIVGDVETGYIIVPDCPRLSDELCVRCQKTGRLPSEWVRSHGCEAS
jgi:predicted RNase H-like nuclease